MRTLLTVTLLWISLSTIALLTVALAKLLLSSRLHPQASAHGSAECAWTSTSTPCLRADLVHNNPDHVPDVTYGRLLVLIDVRGLKNWLICPPAFQLSPRSRSR